MGNFLRHFKLSSRQKNAELAQSVPLHGGQPRSMASPDQHSAQELVERETFVSSLRLSVPQCAQVPYFFAAVWKQELPLPSHCR